MQDEIVVRSAGAVGADLTTAEAHRADRNPAPNSTDLYFQGRSWFNRGLTPNTPSKAPSRFDGALLADPDKIEALVISAPVDLNAATILSRMPVAKLVADFSDGAGAACH